MTHFRVQYLLVTGLFAGLFLLSGRFKIAAFPILIAIINAAYVAPLYFGSAAPESSHADIVAVSANVYAGNRDYQRFIRYIRQTNPDFFLVMEVRDHWLQALEELQDEYPHRLTRARTDHFGIAFYSRLPAEELRLIELGGVSVPAVFARLKVDDGVLTVFGVHTLPPASSGNAYLRNRQINSLAEAVSETTGPVLVLGDLNMTSWSPNFADLLEHSGLRDSRQGFGVQPTWPQQLPLLFIPIDHALVSKSITVHNRRVGPNIGSDHRPISLEFRVKATEQ